MSLILTFIAGACVGSFLNVCICRIPAGESVVFPRSRCACGTPIPFWLNIPLLSWLLLRGKARCCGRRIPFRYFLVEILTATVFSAVSSAANGIQNAVIGCIFCSVLLVISFIDIDTMEICDAIVFAGMLCGIAFSAFFPGWQGREFPATSTVDSLLGMCFGSGLMFWIATFGELAFGREAVGCGDVKLMGMVGAFIGCKGSVFAVFGGCFMATVIALPIALLLKAFRWKNFKIPREVPFAPFVAVGSIAYMLFGQALLGALV
jgi:leader peptidase (prepilin peptidase)/N-methyltransferase